MLKVERLVGQDTEQRNQSKMRRRRPDKRVILPDPVYKDMVVAKFINNLMFSGKKSLAERIVYRSIDILASRKTENRKVSFFNLGVGIYRGKGTRKL